MDWNQPHLLQLTLEKGEELYYLSWKVICPFGDSKDPDRPCGTWMEKSKDDPCTCDCDSCLEGAHEDCESADIEEIGTKFCKAEPIGECYFESAMVNVGTEMFTVMEDLPPILIPVQMTGYSWDSPIEISIYKQPQEGEPT